MIDRVTRSCLWSRFSKSGYGWKVNGDNALLHMFCHNVNIIFSCFLTFVYILVYIYMISMWLSCNTHYIYIFIFLCRLLMVSHIYLFQLDTWQGGLFWTKPLCWILGPPVRQRIKDHMQHSAEGIVNKVGPGHRIGRWLTRHSKTSVLYTYVSVYYIFIDIS